MDPKSAPIYIFTEGVPDIADAISLESLREIGADLGCPDLPHFASDSHVGVLGRTICLPDLAPAPLFLCGDCTSTFDVAWRLAAADLLPEWASIVALRQTQGRGQMRRPWHSPAGNLFVSFRLPASGLFEDEAAAVLTALLCARAFSAVGLRLFLKWPNDLVLPLPEAVQVDARSGKDGCVPLYGKVGGLLLEERSGVLVAGLGINCCEAPSGEMLRKDAAMRATVLPEPFYGKSGLSLWLALVRHVILEYNQFFANAEKRCLLYQAEDILIWKGQNIVVSHSNEAEGAQMRGLLQGLSAKGGLVLQSGGSALGARQEIFSGSINLDSAIKFLCG